MDDDDRAHKYHDRLLAGARRRPNAAWRLLTSCVRRPRRTAAPASYAEPMTYGQAMRLAERLHGGRPPPLDRRGAGASSFDEAGAVWCHAPALGGSRRPLCCSPSQPDERPPPPPPPPRPL